MTDQQSPGEAAFAEAWPGLRRRWIDEELTIERYVQAAFMAGWEARSKTVESDAMRLRFSPDGGRELAEETYRAKVSPFEAPRSWVRDIMGKARPEQSPGTIDWSPVPEPDLIQHGTVTGRIGPVPPPPQHPVGPVFDIPGQAPYGPPPVTRIEDYTAIGLTDWEPPAEGPGVRRPEPGMPGWLSEKDRAKDQRYVPTTTMVALPDDTNPGFRVPDYTRQEG